MSVYLLHFQRRYKHARHYMGFCESDDVSARIERHRAGNGARLMSAVFKAGIPVRIARLWRGRKADRTFERRLKNSCRLADLCPICSGPRAHRRGRL
jgi:hypothetical protein